MPLPLFEMKISKKPIAIIKLGDRNVDFVRVTKYNSKYFATRDEKIFELDDEYEYRYKNTGVYFYNFSNSKPLSLTAMNEIDQHLKTNGESELFNKERFMNVVGDDPSIDVTRLSIPKDVANDLSHDTRRFLQDHATDDESAKTDMMVKVHTQRNPIPTYSSKLLGMGVNKGHFAVIQIGYMKLDFVPMFIHDNRAYTSYGVFEINKDNVYFLKKQMVCFFVISNDRDELTPPLPKKSQIIMKEMIKKKRWTALESFNVSLAPFSNLKKNFDSPNSKESQDKNPTHNPSQIWQPNPDHQILIPQSVSLSSEKKLVQYQADSPSIAYTTMKELYLTKQAVATKLSDPLKKVIPIALIFGAVMGLAIVMSNLPPVIDTVADRVSGKPQVMVMTPEEYDAWRINQGLDPVQPQSSGTPSSEASSASDTNQNPVEPPPVDTTPPLMEFPTETYFEADNTNGMKIEYTVLVTDDFDQGLVAECDPKSGSILTIGDHTIRCVVQDSSGNMARGSFDITIGVREGVEPTSIIPRIAPMPPIEPPPIPGV